MISKNGIQKIVEFNEFNNKKWGNHSLLEEDLFYESYNNINGFNFYVSKDLFELC
jgi:hypothetical protein